MRVLWRTVLPVWPGCSLCALWRLWGFRRAVRVADEAALVAWAHTLLP